MHVTYNHLNLPVLIDFGSNNKIEYLYTATGARIKTTVYTNGTITKEMHYAANIVYIGSKLDHILDWYAYGFRMMDPQLGRWHVVDALAENNTSAGPYAYVQNNPVNYIDMLGLDRLGFDKHESGGGIWQVNYNFGSSPAFSTAINKYQGMNYGGGNFEDYYTEINGTWVKNSEIDITTYYTSGFNYSHTLYYEITGTNTVSEWENQEGEKTLFGIIDFYTGENEKDVIDELFSIFDINDQSGGGLTWSRAKAHYQFGGGTRVDVALSSIDLSRVSLSDFNDRGLATIRLDSKHVSSANDALVHGTITLQLTGSNTAKIALNSGLDFPQLKGQPAGMYNFEIQSWGDAINWLRNPETFLGGLINGIFVIHGPTGPLPIYTGGTPFPIYYHGSVTIPQ